MLANSDTLLSSLSYWHWLSFAVILFISELLTGGGFLFWIAISAAIVGMVQWFFPSMPWSYQMLLFSFGAVVSAVLWWLHLKKHPLKSEVIALNRRNEQYIGRIFTLEEPIVNGVGRIKVDDSVWRVEGDDLPAGAKVRIVGVDGIILKAQKVDKIINKVDN